MEGQPEKQVKEEKENMKKAVGENTEKRAATAQKKQSEQPKKTEAKPDFSVYMPDLSAFKPKIRVVRSSKG